MKRVKLAISILILLPALIICAHFYLKQATTGMSDTLGQAESALLAGDNEEAARQVAAFQKSWNVNKTLLSTFIRHAELDVVNLSSARLNPYLEAGENVDFCAEAETLRCQLKHIWESEQFNVDNIF